MTYRKGNQSSKLNIREPENCSTKDIQSTDKQSTDQEKTFAEQMSNRRVGSEMYKESLKPNNKEIIEFLKLSNHLKRHFVMEDTLMAYKHIKWHCASYVTQTMQIKQNQQ